MDEQNGMMPTPTSRGAARAPFEAGYAPAFALIVLGVPVVLAFGGAGVMGMNVVIAALMAVFAICSPLRDGMAGHVIAAAAGVVALLVANTRQLATFLFGVIACTEAHPCPVTMPVWTRMAAWLASVGGLLVVLIVAAFVRQMARAERSHLIRSLSHTVLEGVAMIAVSGWYFVPDYMALPDEGGNTIVMITSAVVVVLLALALIVASRWWVAEADPDEHACAPWVGIIVLPTMFAGALVPVAGLLSVMIH